MKRILSVQDISCVGKCSLTVALPVISALGVEAAVLPTAVLSTHTAFPSPAFRDLTEDMAVMADHWQKMGIAFDCIATGYLGSEQQATAVAAIYEKFGSFLFVDPVMGDNGKLYSRITRGFVEKMKDLCRRAQVIVPNVTEACCLAGVEPVGACDEAFAKMLLEKLGNLCAGTVLITGVSFGEQLGVAGRDGKTKEYFSYSREKLPRSFHGTGDIFAAALAACFVLEKDWSHAVKVATDYTWETIRATMEENRDPRMGVCFEKTLSRLPDMIK
ncbi:MAG: pyridoxamine kinase [Oscillospiraceae bacterium]|nr:pyridoxamine kinase [Oscillospiraceae bacterium]